MSGNVLVLIGSPRHAKGTACSIAAYLADRLRTRGVAAETAAILPAMRNVSEGAILLQRCAAAHRLILISPLYVDSLPAPVMAWMELYHARRRAQSMPARQAMGAIVHCGFPEASQNETALGICEEFAAESGIDWMGGIPLGGVGALGGRPLERTGVMGRHLRRGLDLAAVAWAGGQPLAADSVALASRPLMARWLYCLVGNMGFLAGALRNRTLGSIHARPCE